MRMMNITKYFNLRCIPQTRMIKNKYECRDFTPKLKENKKIYAKSYNDTLNVQVFSKIPFHERYECRDF